MALPTFGVTPDKVRRHHFPQMATFSASTTPDITTVTEMVQSEAAELAGRLVTAGCNPTSIDATANPSGYVWCADTVRMGAAVRAMRSMTGQNPAVVDALTKELNERYVELEKVGLSILGDVPIPSDEAGAPRSYFTATTTDMTDVTRFRKDDEL